MRTFISFFLTVISVFALDNSVTHHDLSGSTQSNRVISTSRLFAEGELPGGCAVAYLSGNPLTTQTDVKSVWDDGSLKHAIVTYEVPSITSNGSVQVEFRDSGGCNNDGYLTYTQITNGSVPWGAQLEATANSITNTRNAQTMLETCGSISSDPFAASCRYWLAGPLVTQVIIENRATNRPEDFGWQYTGGAWQAPANDTYKSLHPIFVATFYTPSSGGPFINTLTIVENAWMDRYQRQHYTFVIKTGSPLNSPTLTIGGRKGLRMER